MLALGYPGGPIIDRLAAHGNAQAVRFNEPKMSGNVFDFSFSGIKTAVLYHLRRNPQLEPEIEAREQALARGDRSADALRALSSAATLDLIASFQRAVVDNLISRTLAAAEKHAARTMLVSGGVAANSELRRTFEAEGKRRGHRRLFSQPRAFDRQRRDDRRRRLRAFRGRRTRRFDAERRSKFAPRVALFACNAPCKSVSSNWVPLSCVFNKLRTMSA